MHPSALPHETLNPETHGSVPFPTVPHLGTSPQRAIDKETKQGREIGETCECAWYREKQTRWPRPATVRGTERKRERERSKKEKEARLATSMAGCLNPTP